MATTTADDLLSALRQAEAERAQHEAAIVAATQTLAARRAEIAEAEALRDSIVQYHHDIKANNDTLTAVNVQLTDRRTQLTAQVEVLEQRAAALTFEIAASKTELAALA